MKVLNSYNPMFPVANTGALVSPVSTINSVSSYYDSHRTQWWDMLSSQLGNKVTDLLKENLYSQKSLSQLFSPLKEESLRIALEEELWNEQKRQASINMELQTKESQLKILQIKAKSDLWLEEKKKLTDIDLKDSSYEENDDSVENVSSTSNKETNDSVESIFSKESDDSIESTSNKETSNSIDKSLEDKKNSQILQELKAVDASIRTHEAAHISLAGGIAKSGANYSYVRGPDGNLYAVAGEVSIDISQSGDPKVDIQKARQIRAAALAPSDPSPQDHQVASNAVAMEIKAQIELSQKLSEELKKDEGAKIYQNSMQDLQKSQSSPISFKIVA